MRKQYITPLIEVTYMEQNAILASSDYIKGRGETNHFDAKREFVEFNDRGDMFNPNIK